VAGLSFHAFAATIAVGLYASSLGVYAPISYIKEGFMASKKGNRIVIKLRSTESGHTYTTLKNRKNDPNRLELRRYDPTVRRHVAYRETK
jgi:large subunit ribosomal protein L33